MYTKEWRIWRLAASSYYLLIILKLISAHAPAIKSCFSHFCFCLRLQVIWHTCSTFPLLQMPSLCYLYSSFLTSSDWESPLNPNPSFKVNYKWRLTALTTWSNCQNVREFFSPIPSSWSCFLVFETTQTWYWSEMPKNEPVWGNLKFYLWVWAWSWVLI